MKFITLAILLVVAALAAVALLNWPALSAVTSVSLGVTEVQAPLGLVVLACTAVLGLLFVVHIVAQQAGAVAEGRLHAKELATQRDLAVRAEASRFSELRAYLDSELRRMDTQAAEQRGGLLTRIDSLQLSLQAKVDEAVRSLSAHVGELDHKLDRPCHVDPADGDGAPTLAEQACHLPSPSRVRHEPRNADE